MVAEILRFLDPRPGEVFVDGTVGSGGHAAAIAARIVPGGTLVGLDWDEAMLRIAADRLRDFDITLHLVKSDFRDIETVLAKLDIGLVNGIILDLGVCSDQLDDPERGLAFRFDAPLDMRLDRSEGETAASLLNRLQEQEIARLLWEYGEERWANAIAREILRRRQKGRMKTTGDLVAAVLEAIPKRYQDKRIHPATRTFQAVRIAVNRELEGLGEAIEAMIRCLKLGKRLCVLSYHSVEDRIVKHTLKRLSLRQVEPSFGTRNKSSPRAMLLSEGPRVKILTKKPLEPSEQEIQTNPRARSAKLRVAERSG